MLYRRVFATAHSFRQLGLIIIVIYCHDRNGRVHSDSVRKPDAIRSDKQRHIDGCDVVRTTSTEADGNRFSFVSSDLSPGQALHDIYESVFKNQFLLNGCSD